MRSIVDFLDDSIECTFEVSAIKATIVSGLISLIAKFLPQVPDGLNDSEKDPVMSLSLGLDLISTLDIRSLLAYSSQKEWMHSLYSTQQWCAALNKPGYCLDLLQS